MGKKRMDKKQYFSEFGKQIDLVFNRHPELYDQRKNHPWLIGALGDPFSGIWFVAEHPSLTMVERAGPWRELTHETQWSESRGDKLLREKLVKYGFKKGGVDSKGGWNCYLTNIIKEAHYPEDWHRKSQDLRDQAVGIWLPVFQWELANSNPKLIVIMGRQVESYLTYLNGSGKIHLPRTEFIQHYAYIGQRAQGHLGPMHPQRVQEYDEQMANIADIFHEMQS
jgi:hypothetical protein